MEDEIKESKNSKYTEKFHERFDIEINNDEVKNRFLNRFINRISTNFIESSLEEDDKEDIKYALANMLGEEYYAGMYVENFIKGDFHKCLQAIETTYITLKNEELKIQLEYLINLILSESEIDLGIKWENGQFIRSGAKLLDQKLVNEPIRWLAKPGFEHVYNPFTKGLSHFLKAEKDPKLLYDVITDMYEALEGLSKIVTGRQDKDLSSNAELFISKLKVSENYKKILKEYISYANEFRHALKKGQKRPKLSINEVESFVYLTGLFIRLAIEGIET